MTIDILQGPVLGSLLFVKLINNSDMKIGVRIIKFADGLVICDLLNGEVGILRLPNNIGSAGKLDKPMWDGI